MPRGRKKKIKPVINTIAQGSTDLFQFVTNIIGRDLTNAESLALVDASRTYVKDNMTPTQVFDEDVLKEEVLIHGIVDEKLEVDEDDDDEDTSYRSRRAPKGYCHEDQGEDRYDRGSNDDY